ncbi:MAG TPA: helix-turn-helix domain-containing protein [Candidatus Acidoferrales bacterium]|nr:helix-turn-helix domain-containing protein [Candidatus Acidoferrales bacterium]
MELPWPGNVRELENFIERAVLLSRGPEIDADALFSAQLPAPADFPVALPEATKKAKELIEKEKINEALQKSRGKRSSAARLLGISRAALYKKLKRYDLIN